MSLRREVDVLTQLVDDLRYCSGAYRRRIEKLEGIIEKLQNKNPTEEPPRVPKMTTQQVVWVWDGKRWQQFGRV